MNQKDFNQQITLTRENLQKASLICAALDRKVNEDLIKADISAGFYKNPQEAILEEQAIKEAPQHFIALAAYMSQAVEGLQNAFLVLNAKVDALANAFAQSNDHVSKAIAAQEEIVKAFVNETPSTFFKAQPQFSQAQQRVITEELQFKNATRGQIIAALERLCEGNKVPLTEISYFESTGKVHAEHEGLVKEYLTKG